MARLPQQGGDSGVWGTILNDYLSQSHNLDGTLKDGVVSPATLNASLQISIDKADTALQALDVADFVMGVGPYTSSVPGRPTAGGAFVIWNGTTDPGSNAVDGDFWIAP